MANGDDPISALRRLSEKYQQIKLGPGVVGKTGRVAIALCIVWAIVVWRLSGTLADIGLLLGACIITGFCIWWVNKTHKFAEEHPDTALLEGAQLLEYQKWEAEVRGLPALKSPKIPDPHLLGRKDD